MPLSTEKLRGRILPSKPNGLSRCGMSIAKYAQHRDTLRWYELSGLGDIIGSPLKLDFYTQVDTSRPQKRSQLAEKPLAKT
ncbi:hypothetical protein C1752_03370 [Acaryochloris thomasi RCC1774]|uniref:Uncharacterized protein n=1 Tax=Acaryochloris thomasi RCC1774 TaxID=1764569 RepID=A0A2W1JH57_9CYAN|nr:hypothetical protein [Acaryochloris thomasi]PZD72899.1 hypothetical protein C1752_03370 [Acaryochloris thomasi RCC1774]